MLRVLSVIHAPEFGGPHNRNLHLAGILRQHDVHLTVLLPAEDGNARKRLEAAGVDVVVLPLSRMRATLNPVVHLRYLMQLRPQIEALRKLVREGDYEIVQINGLANPQGAIAGKLECKAVVWQLLDMRLPMIMRGFMMLFVRCLADVVMATGKRVAFEHPGMERLHERLMLFCPPVDVKRFSPDLERRNNARAELSIAGDEIVIGTIGNINPQKGHLLFIQAAAELHSRLPRARFVILGRINPHHKGYAEGLWAQASRLGLSVGTDIIVREPGDRVAELASSFDIFWMTSGPRSEGIPTALEEAMALAIPLVSTDVGSITEIVTDGITGFIVRPGDAGALVARTLVLIQDGQLRKRMGEHASRYAQAELSAEKCAERHLDAYRLALGKASCKVIQT